MKRLHGPLATLLTLCLITGAHAQKVVLYEGISERVSWFRRLANGAGCSWPRQKPDVVMRAEIEIPEPKIQMRLSVRRNDDKQLPAGHAVEIVFTLPPDFLHGGISNVLGILAKQGETTLGVKKLALAVNLVSAIDAFTEAFATWGQ